MKPALHCDKKKQNGGHKCCISIREVTYASAVSLRKYFLENAKTALPKWQTKTADSSFLSLFLLLLVYTVVLVVT